MQRAYVYGSLRKGHYNFKSFSGISYIKTTKLKGWDLFSLGSYPGIKPGKGTLVVDLVEMDNATYKQVLKMELGAGYSEIDITIDGISGKFFPYNYNLTELVPSGDWSDYKKY